MGTRMVPRELVVTIASIIPLHRVPGGLPFDVEYSVNGVPYRSHVELHATPPFGFSSSGFFLFTASDGGMPIVRIADYVYRAAMGEALTFPIALGDIGTSELLRLDRSFPHIPAGFPPP
jgi:hypothetical protein